MRCSAAPAAFPAAPAAGDRAHAPDPRHLAALGCPIAGDRLYGGGTLAARPLLHSAALYLVHPLTTRVLV